MKKVLFLILYLIVGMALGMAESPSELFKGNVLLTELFVSPLGMENLIGDTDAHSVEGKILDSGLEYKKMSMGPLGEVFCIFPTNMKIGETEIASVAMAVNNNYTMLMYQSKECDDYQDMCRVLDTILRKYAEKADSNDTGHGSFTIYMLSEQWGVAVGSDDNRKVSMAYLLDIENLKGFIGLDK